MPRSDRAVRLTAAERRWLFAMLRPAGRGGVAASAIAHRLGRRQNEVRQGLLALQVVGFVDVAGPDRFALSAIGLATPSLIPAEDD